MIIVHSTFLPDGLLKKIDRQRTKRGNLCRYVLQDGAEFYRSHSQSGALRVIRSCEHAYRFASRDTARRRLARLREAGITRPFKIVRVPPVKQ